MTAGFAVSMFSQVIMTDNFDSYNTGNLGSQGAWARDGGTNAMAKIAVIDAAHGKSLKMASTASNDGMFIYKEFKWSNRTAGNNVMVAEFDMYPTTNSFAEAQVYEVIGADYYTIFDIYMKEGVGIYLADQADFDEETNGTLLMPTITSNTWYKIKVKYDITDGTMMVYINGQEFGPYEKEAGHSPGEIDIVAQGVNTSGYDNIVISANQTLLAVSDVSDAKAKVSVYPNPATDVINVKSDNKISQISIFDVSGKVVKVSSETSVNVENLAKGTYLVNVKYEDGTTETKKVIKK